MLKHIALGLPMLVMTAGLFVLNVGCENSVVGNGLSEKASDSPGVRGKPILLARRLLFSKDLDSLGKDRVLAKVQPILESPRSPSACLHALVVKQAELGTKNFENDARVQELLGYLLSEQESIKHFGRPLLLKTRFGIRIRDFQVDNTKTGIAESHRDQSLSILALLGVPLDREITFVDQPTARLEQVLDDSIASFHLDQKELAFTAIAYAHYLPPQTSWTNRFGEQFSFNDLASKLLKKDPSQVSCGGLHTLQAILAIHRVHTKHEPIINDETESKVVQYIKTTISRLARNQLESGEWTIDCLSEQCKKRPTTSQDAMVATSHVLECLALAGSSSIVKQKQLDASREWLLVRLMDSTAEEIQFGVCPYSHTACLLLSQRRDGGKIVFSGEEK